MEIKEIDGKKYIEWDEDQARRRRLIMSVAFLILLAIAIIMLISTIYTLVKNKEIIQKDPLRYGMDQHGFVSCQCFDEQGRDWQSEGVGFIHRAEGEGYVNYSSSDFNVSKIEVAESGTV